MGVTASTSTVYHGRVVKGVVVIDGPAALPDGAKVLVQLAEQQRPDARASDFQSLREGLLKFAGVLDGLPVDMAENHDHYIHGTPKR